MSSSRLTEVLQELEVLRKSVARLEFVVVQLVRDSGATWEEIAEELDISRQAAARRFAKPKGRQV